LRESSKSRLHFTPEERALVRGRVLDIGAGDDPVTPDAVAFDQQHGDANRITAFAPDSFDCVYSSHCLEHMHEPHASLHNWWSLVKPGGVLFVIVPDEDLYEQGSWPSRHNSDHKNTFTLAKKRSWSPRSHNLLELALSLPQAELLSLRLNDIGLDRNLVSHGLRAPRGLLKALLRGYRSLRKRGWMRRNAWLDLWTAHAFGIDQSHGDALAQLELVVRKRAA
jgi:SAM-dependent methyltransferase